MNLQQDKRFNDILNTVNIIKLKDELQKLSDNNLDLWLEPKDQDTVQITVSDGYTKTYKISEFNSVQELEKKIKEDYKKNIQEKENVRINEKGGR